MMKGGIYGLLLYFTVYPKSGPLTRYSTAFVLVSKSSTDLVPLITSSTAFSLFPTTSSTASAFVPVTTSSTTLVSIYVSTSISALVP